MHAALKLHPDCRCDAVKGIEVVVSRAHDAVVFLYRATGALSNLRLPQPSRCQRANELWKHTCFEALIRLPAGTAYQEFNFAPSGEWAAYAFEDYRSGMRDAQIGHLSLGAPRTIDDVYELKVTLGPELPLDLPWQLALSAVVEETDGQKSYWALAHPPGKPDFHHSDGFVLTLPP